MAARQDASSHRGRACEAYLAREVSLLLDGDMANVFGGVRGEASGPTSFRGVFGRGGPPPKGAVNEYGCDLRDEGEAGLEKWNSLSNIVPVGVQLDQPGFAPPAPSRPLQQQKQGSQQRGPGRPAMRPPQQPQQGKPGPSSSPKRRAATEPPSVVGAAPPAAAGAAPAGATAGARAFKFRVKLGGKVVGGSSSSGAATVGVPPETSAIVDTMCGLGAQQLLSPIPSQWSHILESGSAALPCAASPPAQLAQQLEQPGAAPPQRPVAVPRVQELDHPAGQQQQQQVDPGEARAQQGPAQQAPDGRVQQEQRAAAAAEAGLQSVLSSVPSAWGRMLDSPAPAAELAKISPVQEGQGSESLQPAPSSEAIASAGVAQQQPNRPALQQQQQHPTAAPLRTAKRSLDSRDEQRQGAEQRASGGDAGSPAPKRPRSASAEPSSKWRGSTEPQATRPSSAAAGAAAPAAQLAAPSPSKRPPSGLIPKRETTPAASAKEDRARQQQQQQPAPVADNTVLGAVAAPLQAVAQWAADAASQAPGGNIVQLQDEGRRLKRFAERKMAGERHTHVSCTFLLSAGLKFLAAAGIMEATPHKYSRDSASTMYSQTAAMLESCAHASARADGPALGTQVVALLAERLGAVARLRAAHCVRNELHRDAVAFRMAVEGARGETFQRPSPSDSNVSATMSIPLEGGSPGGAAQQAARRKPGAGSGGSGSAAASPSGKGSSNGIASGPAAAAAGKKASAAPAKEEALVATAVPAPALLGLPRGVVDRELGMAGHMQGVMGALSALGRSAERLRDYMAKAAAEGNVHALRAAAGAALLSADAGMGRIEAVLNIGREALDAAMKIES